MRQLICYNSGIQTVPELQEENAQIRAQLLAREAALEVKDQHLQAQKEALQSKDHLIEQLKEALILARNRQFAKTTESLRSLQSVLFDEAEVVLDDITQTETADEARETVEVTSYRRQKGGRKPLPEDLPRIEIVHDLADEDKVCERGHELVFMSDKVSEQLDIIPMQIQVIRHIRKQYHCPCCDSVIKTAAKPKRPIEKSIASPGLLSYVTVSKYSDSLPLCRQSRILQRFEVELPRSTLANWMIQAGELVQPLINRLEDQLLQAPLIHMDETPVQVLNDAGKTAQSKSYMWVRGGAPPKPVILFDYAPGRGGNVLQRLLQGYAGALMVDGYEGYNAVCKTDAIRRLGCWVHARRKFVEVGKASKKKNGQAAYALKLIARLYKIEKAHRDSNAEERHRARQRDAKPIIDKLKAWKDDLRPKVPPKTALGKALHYLDNQWPRLIRYLNNGAYPIDNNRVENAIRPFAVGRKNWLFSASVTGAKASANLYSLIETAKANGLEPYAYLKQVFTALPNAESYDDVEALLPWNIKR